MDYRMTFDIHTHTTYSHGKGSIEDNVRAAAEKGLRAVAITDHGPGHLTYGIKKDKIPFMRRDIEACREKYPEIDITLGVEANIVDKMNGIDIPKEEIGMYDFIIAGYHYGVTNGYCLQNYAWEHGHVPNRRLMVKNTDMCLKAIYENDLRILTHPGDKGPFDIAELAKACSETNTWMEISTHHKHLNIEEIRICAKENVKFVISSDAHVPQLVGSFEDGLIRAIEAGIDPDRIVNVERIR